MSDALTIPRTYAGQVGAADVTDCVKRKFICVDFLPTTGRMYGNGTTGGYLYQRPQVVEKLTLLYHAAGTTTNTAKFRLRAMKNASILAASSVIGSATKHCTTTGWKRVEITPSITSILATDRLWFEVTHHTAGQTGISVVLETKEAVA
jgi:hypothetical protein